MSSEPQAEMTRERRRIRNSVELLGHVTLFGMFWLVFGLVLGAHKLALAALVMIAGFALGVVLHRASYHLVARVSWLSITSCTVGYASFILPPEGYVSFILVPVAVVPLAMFNLREEKLWAALMTLAPISLWLFAWYMDYQLFGEYDVSVETAESIVAPVSGLTVFLMVLFEVGHFAQLSQKHMRRLKTARREAEQASAAKSDLVQSVSHEMRTPLHSIAGYTELLLSDARAGRVVSKADLLKYVGQIQRSSNEMLLMVENILDFAATNAEEDLKVRLDAVPLKATLDRVIARFDSEIAAKELTVVCDVDPDLSVQADADMFASALKQVVDNAVKFSGRGGKISITSKPISGANKVDITFRDTGPGFPEGAQQQAFVPFERLGHKTGATSGLGIGLPLAKAFLDAMGGQILVDNAHAGGAKVRVILSENRPENGV